MNKMVQVSEIASEALEYYGIVMKEYSLVQRTQEVPQDY